MSICLSKQIFLRSLRKVLKIRENFQICVASFRGSPLSGEHPPSISKFLKIFNKSQEISTVFSTISTEISTGNLKGFTESYRLFQPNSGKLVFFISQWRFLKINSGRRVNGVYLDGARAGSTERGGQPPDVGEYLKSILNFNILKIHYQKNRNLKKKFKIHIYGDYRGFAADFGENFQMGSTLQYPGSMRRIFKNYNSKGFEKGSPRISRRCLEKLWKIFWKIHFLEYFTFPSLRQCI